MREYAVRTYQKGDEVQLTRLFNESYEAYAGFAPRTPEYWRWSCLDRPDVENEGILVVLREARVVAYAVVGKSGNIWELCFDRRHEAKALVSLILKSAVEYLASRGSDSVTLNLPRDDLGAREGCEKEGFLELPRDPEWVYVSVLDYERFVRLLYSAKKEGLMGFECDFLIRLKNAESWTSPFVSITLQGGRLETSSQDKSCDVLIETDTSTLNSILFGISNPVWALLSFKLKIHPLHKLRSVIRFFSILSLDDPWFLPRADLG